MSGKYNQRKIDRIRRFGTPDQIQEMELYLEMERETKIKQTELVQETIKKAIKAPPQKDPEARPNEINYQKAARAYWAFFRKIVFKETGNKINGQHLDGNMPEIMKGFVNYAIGDPGLFDPNKSIFLWGQAGVGKSTLALAAHYLMYHTKVTTKWKNRFFDFCALNEVFYHARVQSDLGKYSDIAKGNQILDELKEDQMTVKYYGSTIGIAANLLEIRHNEWKRNNTKTIITSNIAPSQMADLLQDEILMTRLRQEYTIIELTGSNKRELQIKS